MITPDQIALLERSLELLVTMLIGGTVAAYIFRNYFNWLVILGSFVLALVMIWFVIPPVVATGNAFLIYGTLFVFGAAVAADLGGFFAALGALNKMDPEETNRATLTVLGIAFGATLVASLIGLFSGANLLFLARPLYYILLVLLGLSIGGLVGFVSRRAEWFIGIFASGFWFVYLIFHFNRIVFQYTEDSWPAAVEISMNIYLALVNFIVRIAPYVFKALADN